MPISLSSYNIDPIMLPSAQETRAARNALITEAANKLTLQKAQQEMAQQNALAEAYRRTGRVFQAGTQRRSLPNFGLAADLARRGQLGKLQTLHAHPMGLTTLMRYFVIAVLLHVAVLFILGTIKIAASLPKIVAQFTGNVPPPLQEKDDVDPFAALREFEYNGPTLGGGGGTPGKGPGGIPTAAGTTPTEYKPSIAAADGVHPQLRRLPRPRPPLAPVDVARAARVTDDVTEADRRADVDGVGGRERAVAPEAVEIREPLERTRDGLDEQHSVEQAFGHRQRRVRGLEPA